MAFDGEKGIHNNGFEWISLIWFFHPFFLFPISMDLLAIPQQWESFPRRLFGEHCQWGRRSQSVSIGIFPTKLESAQRRRIFCQTPLGNGHCLWWIPLCHGKIGTKVKSLTELHNFTVFLARSFVNWRVKQRFILKKIFVNNFSARMS